MVDVSLKKLTKWKAHIDKYVQLGVECAVSPDLTIGENILVGDIVLINKIL